MVPLTIVLFFTYLSISLCDGFLLNTTGHLAPSGGVTSLTDGHFITVIDMVTEEKKMRLQLEQYIQQLSNEFATMQQELNSVRQRQQSNQSQELSVLKNESESLKQTVLLLKQEIEEIRSENVDLNGKLKACVNQSKSFQSESNAEATEIAQLRMDMRESQSKIRLLVEHSKKDNHDLVVLQNQSKVCLERLNKIENDIKDFKLTQNGAMSDIGQYIVAINRTVFSSLVRNEYEDRECVESLNKTIMKTISKLENEVSSLDTSHRQDLNMLENRITEINYTIAVSACALNGSYNQGDVIRFPNVTSSTGISGISSFINTAAFICEVPGFYFVSCFVMSYSQFASYYILHNNREITHIYIQGGSGTFQRSNYATGTSVQVVYLYVGDKLVVEAAYQMYVYGSPHSCMTIFKLK